MAPPEWPAARRITTTRLGLEPLRVEHADEMAPTLDDAGLHEFIGGRPATVDEPAPDTPAKSSATPPMPARAG